jgi:hypothetical protein
MRISWPRTHLQILPSFVASQVHGKFRNMSSLSVVHYMLNRLSKLACLAPFEFIGVKISSIVASFGSLSL